MEDNPLVTLRTVIKTLRELHKVIRQKRRELAVVIAGVEDVEMVSARIGFSIRQLEDAANLYSKLMRSNEEPPSVEGIELTLAERGHEIRRDPEDE